MLYFLVLENEVLILENRPVVSNIKNQFLILKIDFYY